MLYSKKSHVRLFKVDPIMLTFFFIEKTYLDYFCFNSSLFEKLCMLTF